MEDYMTAKAAAKELGLAVSTISRLIDRNILKGEKFGPVWMVDAESVAAYKQRNEGKAKHDPTRGIKSD